MGPTGVGKTELAQALAEFMFGSEDALIKIDMSEFMERHNVSRLVGAPPGYVGYDEGGQLTEAVRRKSYSVVLLDEIEKAHPEVFNILLQILEDGHLTDAKGRRVDFRNTIIIMTSNVGAPQLQQDKSIGFRGTDATVQAEARRVRPDEGEGPRRAEERLPPRVPQPDRRHGRLPPAHPGGDQGDRGHAAQRVVAQLAGQQMELVVTDAAKDAIIEKGYDQAFGARPLRREIQNQIEDPLAEQMLMASFEAGDTIQIDVAEDGTLSIEKASRPPRDRKRSGHRRISGRYARHNGRCDDRTGGCFPRSLTSRRVPHRVPTRSVYVCQQCGSTRRNGRTVPACEGWNTLVETVFPSAPLPRPALGRAPLRR